MGYIKAPVNAKTRREPTTSQSMPPQTGNLRPPMFAKGGAVTKPELNAALKKAATADEKKDRAEFAPKRRRFKGGGRIIDETRAKEC